MKKLFILALVPLVGYSIVWVKAWYNVLANERRNPPTPI